MFYRIGEMRQLVKSPAALDKQRLELLIFASLLRLAHELHGDRVNLDALYTGWDFHRQEEDFTVALNVALVNGTWAAVFNRIAPQSQAYRYLVSALQIYTAIKDKGGWPARPAAR